MENENRMVFYQTFYDLASLLPETERRKVLTAMLDYFFEGIEPASLSANGMKVFNGIRGRIEASKAKANNRRGKTRIKQYDETDNETDNKSDNKTSNKNSECVRIDKSPSPSPSYSSNPYPKEEVQGEEPPTLDEVRAYFQANCLRGDPEEFFDHYAAQGWVRGNGLPVEDWSAQARKWSRDQVRIDHDREASGKAPSSQQTAKWEPVRRKTPEQELAEAEAELRALGGDPDELR